MQLGDCTCNRLRTAYERPTDFWPRPQIASSLFLQHNTALAPPYRVLIDTNFINFSLQNKLELISGMMDCLYAKCVS